MQFSFHSSVTSRQRAWFQEAVKRVDYPLANVGLTVTVSTVPEPSCEGHRDYMCATVNGALGTVEIREGADNPDAIFNQKFKEGGLSELKRFYAETVVHEVGHLVTFSKLAEGDRPAVCALFTLDRGEGEGDRRGTIEDWNPLDAKWEDRIQEAVAEVFKDTFLEESGREFENRSNWDISEDDWKTLMSMLGATGSPEIPGDYTWLGGKGSAGGPGIVGGDDDYVWLHSTMRWQHDDGNGVPFDGPLELVVDFTKGVGDDPEDPPLDARIAEWVSKNILIEFRMWPTGNSSNSPTVERLYPDHVTSADGVTLTHNLGSGWQGFWPLLGIYAGGFPETGLDKGWPQSTSWLDPVAVFSDHISNLVAPAFNLKSYQEGSPAQEGVDISARYPYAEAKIAASPGKTGVMRTKGLMVR